MSTFKQYQTRPEQKPSNTETVYVAVLQTHNNIYEKLIYLWQMLCNPKYAKYVHSELIIRGEWHTTSLENNGYFKSVRQGTSDWAFVPIVVPMHEVDQMLGAIELRKNREYDVRGILFTQFIPLRYQDQNKDFCSEFVTAVLRSSKTVRELYPELVKENPAWYSPARLIKALHGSGARLISYIEYEVYTAVL